jgi:hypothetical protein
LTVRRSRNPHELLEAALPVRLRRVIRAAAEGRIAGDLKAGLTPTMVQVRWAMNMRISLKIL